MIHKYLRGILLFAVLTAALISVYTFDRDYSQKISQLSDLKDSYYSFTCKICGFPVRGKNSVRALAQVTDADCPIGVIGERVLIYAPLGRSEYIEYGNTVKFTSTVTPPEEAANRGGFSYRRYLESENAVAVLYAYSSDGISVTDRAHGPKSLMYILRNKAIKSIDRYFAGDEAALMKAMLTGDRSNITDEAADAYKNAGIYHIVAVSGLHAGIFITVITYALYFIPLKRRRKNYVIKLMSAAAAVLLYMFTGFGISITRVILMMGILLISFAARREYDIIYSIAATACTIIFAAPYELFSMSFQLSFLSTLGLCCAISFFRKNISESLIKNPVVCSTVMSAGSLAATAHICVYNFSMLSLMGFVSNIFVIPMSAFLLASLIGFALASAILPHGILLFLRYIPIIPARIINFIAMHISNLSFSHISVQPFTFFAATAVLGVFSLFAWLIISKRYALFTLALACASVCVFAAGVNLKDIRLSVIFLNMGRGESTLIRSYNGENILIDCGSASADNPAKDLFIPYFEHSGIKQIDKLFISYFDNDHISAVDSLIVSGFIKRVYLPPKINITSENSDVITHNRLKIIDTAQKYGVSLSEINPGDTVKLSEDSQISLSDVNSGLSNKNACPVYTVRCGNISFMLSSCLGAKGQNIFPQSNEKCTVLKIPSYGRMTKGTESFILSSEPQYAVITIPSGDKYNMLDDALCDILSSNGIKYARTDINSTISFTTDGKSIKSIYTRKGELQ